MSQLRRRVQTEFVLLENGGDTTHADKDELELSRFQKIWKDIVKVYIEPQTVKDFFRIICEKNLEYVEYEKFNRLCDLFLNAPGLVFKRKNDSENLYLIMSSMAHKTAFILSVS